MLYQFSYQKFMGCHHQPCICKMYNCHTQPLSRFLKFAFSALLSLLLCTEVIQAQTDFAPGQIMFTGYDSDDPDAF